jgi:hypothetical protein
MVTHLRTDCAQIVLVDSDDCTAVLKPRRGRGVLFTPERVTPSASVFAWTSAMRSRPHA